MKSSLYILRPVRIRRKQNTLALEPTAKAGSYTSPIDDLADTWPMDEEEVWWKGVPRHLPVERVSTIYVMAPADFNSHLLVFLSQKQIPLHLFNHYGYYSGTYWPRSPYPNGTIASRQVLQWNDPGRRLLLCKTLLEGAFYNMHRNVMYHQRRTGKLESVLERLKRIDEQRQTCTNIQELLGVEGQYHKVYYEFIDQTAKPVFQMKGRVFRPPDNPGNTLLSFLNSMTYTAVLSELFRTQLDPTIGLLHAPGRHRYPLAYDLAELFKPLLADRLLLSLPNKKQIIPEHFEESLEGCYLKEEGKKRVVRAWESRLRTTIRHRKLDRAVSYRFLIRMEAWKLIRNLIEDKPYESLKFWW